MSGAEVERGRRLLVPSFLTPQQERKEPRRGERRVRARGIEGIDRGFVRISAELHEALERPAEIEIVVPGGSTHTRREAFKVVVDSKVPSSEIHMSRDDMRALGVADNTVVTVRRKL
ncbi:MAG: hypothetical protein LM577_00210 [Thermoproteaceae archaeon]|jgi:hypothetical protein|nr:hypothetical protein [Thermoproteaceae archaeon]